MATTQQRPIMAKFHPQAWIRDWATDIDGAYRFDITDQVVAMGRAASLEIEDNSDTSDVLWETWIAAHPEVERHRGPFTVDCQDAIKAYWAKA